MMRLGRSAEHLRQTYDAVVIGSGYGGGVAASRLARMGLSVAVLERGREWLPGDFPAGLLAAQRALQMRGPKVQLGAPTALFDLRLGADVHVLQGCGLGGTSLINANVCLTPASDVLEDAVWPAAVRAEPWLFTGFHRARTMLRPTFLPEGVKPLKLQALEKAATALGETAARVPLHIAFEAGETMGGVAQAPCTQCGDCMGGCNVGAKTTVHSTYLADAARHGAEIYVETLVRHVERAHEGGWIVTVHRLDAAVETVPVRRIRAATVILAAGTLGSNEILLRSRERGLAISETVGKRLSTNGDAIAFGYNNDVPVNAIGIGHPPPRNAKDPGPAVSGLIDLRGARDPVRRMVIVEAAIQSAMAPLLPMMLSATSALGVDSDRGLKDRFAEAARTAQSLVLGARAGAVHNTQVFLAIGHDSSSGEVVLAGDRAEIRWPGALKEPVYGRIDAVLKEAVAATGGTYVANPAAARLLGGNVFTVHPLGGLVMADTRTTGVVDGRCRVFDGDPSKSPTAVHEGLYVVDGSVMPRSLGVHPLLTITAVAERAMLLLARDRRFALDVEARIAPASRNGGRRSSYSLET